MYHAIYLSPHLDDAALSCGGQIAQRTAVGQHVLIVTIMAGEPPGEGLTGYAQELHGRWQLAHNAVAVRRAEDVAACRILGADFQHWAVPDCIYRLNPADGRPLYTDWAQITGGIHEAERPLLDTLAQQLAQLPACDQVIVPLGVGQHVDHLITRQAAERCFQETLTYYEDYPYVRAPQALAAVIPPHDPDWQAESVSLTTAAIQTKIEAIAAFTSQLSTFFDGRAQLEKQILEDTAVAGGERLWRYLNFPLAPLTSSI
jgi:LmbE family N-acetylglucosaminyl deacetylase